MHTIGSSVGCAGAAGGVGTGEIGEFGVGGLGGVDGRHVSKIHLSSSMAANCESHVMDGTSLSAHMRRRTAWKIRSAGVSDGCVIYSWRKSTVSDMHTVFMSQSINERQK